MKPSVVFIGAGKLGAALGAVMGPNAGSVASWDVTPGKVPDQRPLGELLPSAGIVFFCVPTAALRDAAKSAAPHLKKDAAVVSVSKGLERGSLAMAEEILGKEARTPFVFLGGPLLADEIAAGKTAVGVV